MTFYSTFSAFLNFHFMCNLYSMCINFVIHSVWFFSPMSYNLVFLHYKRCLKNWILSRKFWRPFFSLSFSRHFLLFSVFSLSLFFGGNLSALERLKVLTPPGILRPFLQYAWRSLRLEENISGNKKIFVSHSLIPSSGSTVSNCISLNFMTVQSWNHAYVLDSTPHFTKVTFLPWKKGQYLLNLL